MTAESNAASEQAPSAVPQGTCNGVRTRGRLLVKVTDLLLSSRLFFRACDFPLSIIPGPCCIDAGVIREIEPIGTLRTTSNNARCGCIYREVRCTPPTTVQLPDSTAG